MKRFIPDMITSMNLLCGALGVIFACSGGFDAAFCLMLAAAVFDFCDGLAARMLHAYSDLGKELDSLSDMVSFGVLPSVMMVQMMRLSTFSDSVLCFVPLVFVVAAGIRLARFNVDEAVHEGFCGLAAPAAAMICGSLCCFLMHSDSAFLSAWTAGYVFLPVLSVVLAALMVSTLPMFSLKFKRDDGTLLRRKRLSLLVNVCIIVAIVVFVGLHWSLSVLLSLVVYVVMNLLFPIFRI